MNENDTYHGVPVSEVHIVDVEKTRDVSAILDEMQSYIDSVTLELNNVRLMYHDISMHHEKLREDYEQLQNEYEEYIIKSKSLLGIKKCRCSRWEDDCNKSCPWSKN